MSVPNDSHPDFGTPLVKFQESQNLNFTRKSVADFLHRPSLETNFDNSDDILMEKCAVRRRRLELLSEWFSSVNRRTTDVEEVKENGLLTDEELRRLRKAFLLLTANDVSRVLKYFTLILFSGSERCERAFGS